MSGSFIVEAAIAQKLFCKCKIKIMVVLSWPRLAAKQNGTSGRDEDKVLCTKGEQYRCAASTKTLMTSLQRFQQNMRPAEGFRL